MDFFESLSPSSFVSPELPGDGVGVGVGEGVSTGTSATVGIGSTGRGSISPRPTRSTEFSVHRDCSSLSARSTDDSRRGFEKTAAVDETDEKRRRLADWTVNECRCLVVVLANRPNRELCGRRSLVGLERGEEPGLVVVDVHGLLL